jgi:hypothetical protein
MEFYSATKNEILSFSGKCIELENIFSKVKLRSPKIMFCPSYADYRPKTNATIFLDMGHTKERLHMGGIGQGRKPKT